MTVMTPPPTPPSPSESVYDMSDDEESEYRTIRHVRTGRGVKLLYSKSKVYIHPSPSAKDNIAGFIALVQQKPAPGSSQADQSATASSASSAGRTIPSSSLLLTWMPESALGDAYDTYVKVDLSSSSSSDTPRQSYLVPPPPITTSHSGAGGTYAFAVPVSEIYSLLVRPPSIGWWFGSIIINTRMGDSFPALFFHDSECESTVLQRKKLAKETFDPFGDGGGMFWGGDEVLRWLKQYVNVERAKHEMNAYLIDPSEADRLGFGASSVAGASHDKKSDEPHAGSAKQASRDGGMDPMVKVLKEARWGMLEKLSQVTTFARRAAQNLAENPRLPPQARRLIQNPEVQTIQEEFDSARLYLARWAMGLAEQSEKEKRQRIWTARDVLEMEETPVGDFEILEMEAGGLSLEDRRKPVSKAEWEAFFDPESGVLRVTVDEVKDRIFHGGLNADDGVRCEAWLFLLEVHDWKSTRDERHAHMNSLRDEYLKLKGAWWERMAADDATDGAKKEDSEWWKEQRMRIEKDVHRTDRNVELFAGEDIPHPDPDSPFAEVGTNVHMEQLKDMLLTYNEYNKTLGYVQGMSDLLAPLYAVMQDDAVAFWAFVGFMDRMERNFLRDQSGMRLQLLTLDHLVQLMDPKLYLHLQKAESTNFFFFFRMLLVWYKREFSFDDVLTLWERLWTDLYSADFHLFIALAILEKHRDIILNHLQQFDEVLKFINDLSNTIDLPLTLIKAEALFRRFQRTIEAIDKKDNFPAPSLAQERSQLGEPGPSQSPSKQHEERQGQGAKQYRPDSAGSSSFRLQKNDKDQTTAATVKVISPELRQLLSRTVSKLDRSEIKKHGGGVGS